jgi:peptidyl-tRNA hydrolase
MPTKLRVIVADDLSPGQVAAQSIHAAATFARHHRDAFEDWHDDANIIVVLAATNDELHAIHRRACYHGLRVSSFLEEDLDNKLTAIALAPDKRGIARLLTRKLTPYGAPPR